MRRVDVWAEALRDAHGQSVAPARSSIIERRKGWRAGRSLDGHGMPLCLVGAGFRFYLFCLKGTKLPTYTSERAVATRGCGGAVSPRSRTPKTSPPPGTLTV